MLKIYMISIKRTMFYLILCFIFLMNYQSLASEANPTQDKQLITKINNGEASNHSGRLKTLNDIEHSLTSFNSIIPNPTPEELKWIETEQNEINQFTNGSIDRSREGQLITSIPYTEKRAKELIHYALSWIKK